MRKELQILILGIFFINYVLFLPGFADLTEFYSPNEKFICETGNSFKWLEDSKWGLRLKNAETDKTISSFPITHNPQEVHISNSGNLIILIGMIPETEDITLENFPALSIMNAAGEFLGEVYLGDIASSSRIKKYKNNIYWHDHEKTGFLKSADYFLLTLRGGRKYFINLETLEFVDYKGDETLLDMGWDH